MTPSAVVFAVLTAAVAGPAVLLIARRSMLTPVEPRPVEVSAVMAVAGLTAALVLARPAADAIVLLPLAVLGCAAAVVDAREGRLPDSLTGPLLAGTLLAALVTASSGPVATAAVISAVAGGGVALVIKAAASAAIGWGDVKLVPTLAVVLVRHDAVVPGLVCASLLVAVTAGVVGLRATDGCTLVPYGPALVFGTVGVAVVL